MLETIPMIEIRPDDLSGGPARALLALHLSGMQSSSPPEYVHALDVTGLRAPAVTVWTAWIDGEISGMAALKTLDARTGEIKSMRTHPGHLRKGVASALLDHLVAEASRLGLRTLKLETGSGPAFEPALALYRRHGFRDGEPFGGYVRSGFNPFFSRDL